MPKPYLRDLRAEAERLQRQVGNWVVAGVETSVPWPTTDQVVPYLGLDFILRPATKDRDASVCLNAQAHALTTAEARDAILKLGSAMAWSGDWRFETTMWVGGSHPIGVGRMRGTVVQDFFDVDELSAITDEDTATALAFFREGITSHNPFYGFLNLYKVVAFIHQDGKERGAWVDDALPRITEGRATDRLRALAGEGVNASIYLRDEGRNAIAHSERGTFINPDKVGDQERIERDLPVMQALARIAIEERFCVHHRLSPNRVEPSPIAGFLALLDENTVERILAGEDIRGMDTPIPKHVTVVVRLGAEAHALEGLSVWALDHLNVGLALLMKDSSGSVQMGALFNLKDGTLQMGPDDISWKVTPTSRGSINAALMAHKQRWAYLRNGSVEIWDDATDTLLGKSAPYLPVNVFLEPEWFDKHKTELETLLEKAPED